MVWLDIELHLDHYISGIWENLCRKAVPRLEINGKTFNPASRWWGAGADRKPMEIDVLAESTDKSTLLVGEVKWSETCNGDELENLLERKCRNFPLSNDKTILKALFLKKKIVLRDANIHVLAPDDIVAVSV